jgi:hypothetical protein
MDILEIILLAVAVLYFLFFVFSALPLLWVLITAAFNLILIIAASVFMFLIAAFLAPEVWDIIVNIWSSWYVRLCSDLSASPQFLKPLLGLLLIVAALFLVSEFSALLRRLSAKLK